MIELLVDGVAVLLFGVAVVSLASFLVIAWRKVHVQVHRSAPPLPATTPEESAKQLKLIGRVLAGEIVQLKRYRRALEILRRETWKAPRWELKLADDDPLCDYLTSGPEVGLSSPHEPEIRMAVALQMQMHARRESKLFEKIVRLQGVLDALSRELGIEPVDFLAAEGLREKPLDRDRIAEPRDELADVQKQIGVLREREEALIAKLLAEEQAGAPGPHRKAAKIATRDGN